MKSGWIGMAVSCLIAATALATDDARSRLFGRQNLEGARTKQIPPILFEVDRQDEILASRNQVKPIGGAGPLLPNRIYLVYSPPKAQSGTWYFVLTDFDGHLPEPLETVRLRSIFSGKLLGAKKTPGQRYVSIDKLRWTPTFRPEVHDFFTWTDPPYFRVEEFLPVVKFAKGGEP